MICKNCNEDKPLSEMQPDKNYKSGYSGWCRLCRREYYQNKRKKLHMAGVPNHQRVRYIEIGDMPGGELHDVIENLQTRLDKIAILVGHETKCPMCERVRALI